MSLVRQMIGKSPMVVGSMKCIIDRLCPLTRSALALAFAFACKTAAASRNSNARQLYMGEQAPAVGSVSALLVHLHCPDKRAGGWVAPGSAMLSPTAYLFMK